MTRLRAQPGRDRRLRAEPDRAARDAPLGALAVETARAAIADAGLTSSRSTASSPAAFSRPRARTRSQDGVSIVSANWLAEHLGADPRYAAGFQGFGQIPGSVAMAVNAIASGAADYVLMHRALHNPRGSYHGNPMTEVARLRAVDGAAGLLRAAVDDRAALQRVPAALRRARARRWRGRGRGAQERRAHPVVVLARQAAHRRGVPCRAAARRPDLPLRLRHPGRRRRPRSSSPRPSGRGTCRTARCTSRASPSGSRRARGCRCTGRSTTSWMAAPRPRGGCGRARASGRTTSTCLRCTTASRRSSGSGSRCSASARSGEAHRFVDEGGIDCDRPGALPALSGGGALGNGRMHGVPQMLECYLQLSGRAGDRQRDGVTVGLACHASPHFGGAVVYSAEPFCMPEPGHVEPPSRPFVGRARRDPLAERAAVPVSQHRRAQQLLVRLIGWWPRRDPSSRPTTW